MSDPLPIKTSMDIVKSPLGLLGFFILFIYSVSSLVFNNTFENLTTNQQWFIISFIILFPIVLLMSLIWLLVKHTGKLYSPLDYREDSSFIEMNRKVETVSERLSQSEKRIRVIDMKHEATLVDPRSDFKTPLELVTQLCIIGQIDTALHLTRGYLKSKKFRFCMNLLDRIEHSVELSETQERRVLSMRSYCLINLNIIPEAYKILRKVKLSTPSEFGFWPKIALAFCMLHMGRHEDSDNLLKTASEDLNADDYKSEVATLYPDLSEKFNKFILNGGDS